MEVLLEEEAAEVDLDQENDFLHLVVAVRRALLSREEREKMNGKLA